MIGFDVFFCRIWYFLSPKQRRAYPGAVAVGADDEIVRLNRVSSDLTAGTSKSLRGSVPGLESRKQLRRKL
jgi:hypothetical protein